MKIYVIQSKNGIMMNTGVIEKNQTFAVLLKMIACDILVGVIIGVVRYVKLTNI